MLQTVTDWMKTVYMYVYAMYIYIYTRTHTHLTLTCVLAFPTYVPRNTGVPRDMNRGRKKIENPPKNRYFWLNWNLACMIIVEDTVRIRTFVRTFRLVINRSRCADSYLIGDEQQNKCVCPVNIYQVKKYSVTKKLWETQLYTVL